MIPRHTTAYVSPDYPRCTVVLRNGAKSLVRPIQRGDMIAERRFIEGLSPTTRRQRFLGQVNSPSARFLEALTDIDYANDVALAAFDPDAAQSTIVGVARYAVDNTRERCECAVVVADAWQRNGLGTALMRQLIKIAQERGIRLMESIDLAGNSEMRELAHALGFHPRTDPRDPRQVIYALPLGANPARI